MKRPESHEFFGAKELSERIGVVVFKPDAVRLGIVEELIAHIAEKGQKNNVATINTVSILRLKPQQVESIYSSVLDRVGPEFHKYMLSGPIVVLTLTGNGKDNVLEFLLQIKGKRFKDRSIIQFSSNSLETGIRDLVPVPGTRKRYAKIFKKVMTGDRHFSNREYAIYCQNLIHTPDNEAELIAILELLPQLEKLQNLDAIGQFESSEQTA